MTPEKLTKIRNWQLTASALMTAGGLYMAYKGKKSFWGYVGFGLLGSIIGSSVAYGVGSIVIKDKVADTTTETTETGEAGSVADSVENVAPVE